MSTHGGQGTEYCSSMTMSSLYSLFFFSPHFSFILHAKKTAFVVEHDFIMATYLADRVIVFDGIPSKNTLANR